MGLLSRLARGAQRVGDMADNHLLHGAQMGLGGAGVGGGVGAGLAAAGGEDPLQGAMTGAAIGGGLTGGLHGAFGRRAVQQMSDIPPRQLAMEALRIASGRRQQAQRMATEGDTVGAQRLMESVRQLEDRANQLLSGGQ